MSFTPNIGSLALSPKQEYGFGGTVTTPADSTYATLVVNNSYPNAAGDLTLPGVGDPAVITVNNSGLYSCFFEPCWLTHNNSTTGYRQTDWSDGDGNLLWAELMSSAESAAIGVINVPHTSLLFLPAGLVLTLQARQTGGSTEDMQCFVDIFRML